LNLKLHLRVILALVAVLALGIIGLTYLGDALSLNGMAHCLPESRGSVTMSPEAEQAYLQTNFRRMYDIWGYVRLAGIALLVLTILGFYRAGRVK
jgi:hypothetical protein